MKYFQTPTKGPSTTVTGRRSFSIKKTCPKRTLNSIVSDSIFGLILPLNASKALGIKKEPSSKSIERSFRTSKDKRPRLTR